jgi:hypothetical protein
MVTDVTVPADLSGLSRNELIALRNRLIAAGHKAGGIDERLKPVAEALRRTKPADRPEGKGKKERKKRKGKGGFNFGSLGSGAKRSRLKDKRDG